MIETSLEEFALLSESIMPIIKAFNSAFLYIITSGIIWIILGLILFMPVLFSLFRLLFQKGNEEGGRRFGYVFSGFMESLSKNAGDFISRLPSLAVSLMMFSLVLALSFSIESIYDFVVITRENHRLEKTIDHLQRRYKAGEIYIIRRFRRDNIPYVQFKLSLFSSSSSDEASGAFHTEEYVIAGNRLYFDTLTFNFQFADIENGSARNITIPIAIYSDRTSPSKGIKLPLYSENGTLKLHHLSNSEIYGITPDEFGIQLQRIASWVQNPENARQAGVRSINGSAIAGNYVPGDTFSIFVENTGGLSIQ